MNNRKTISILIPALNESEVILYTLDKILEITNSIDNYKFTIFIIDDGSTDNTVDIIRENFAEVNIISFKDNYGHQTAIYAGLKIIDSDAAIVIDADLQDPPSIILQMIKKWENGFKIVHAVRTKRDGEPKLKLFCIHIFYKLFNLTSKYKAPVNSADFKLIDREIILKIRKLAPPKLYIRGQICQLTTRQAVVYYKRNMRMKGKAKYNILKSSALAANAIIICSSDLSRILLLILIIFLNFYFLSHSNFSYKLFVMALNTIIATIFINYYKTYKNNNFYLLDRNKSKY